MSKRKPGRATNEKRAERHRRARKEKRLLLERKREAYLRKKSGLPTAYFGTKQPTTFPGEGLFVQGNGNLPIQVPTPADLKRIRKHRAEHKADIESQIQAITDVLRQYSPTHLVAAIASQLFGDPETFKESTSKPLEPYLEYVLSIATALPTSEQLPPPPLDVAEDLLEKIERLFFNVLGYFGSEAAEGKRSLDEEEIRYLSLLRFILVRGSSFEQHQRDLFIALFEPHDQYLQRHVGLTSCQILDASQEMEQQITDKVNDQFQLLAKQNIKLNKAFYDFAGDPDDAEMDALYGAFLQVDGIRAEIDEYDRMVEAIHSPTIYEVHETQLITDLLLNALSSGPGENTAFLSFEKAPGWPTNDSIIYERPLYKLNGSYFCFSIPVLHRNLISIVESWLAADVDYYQNKYLKMRGNTLERLAIEHIARLLPASAIHSNLYYDVPVGESDKKRVETDTVVEFDGNVLIVEAKAGSLSRSARRGSLVSIRQDVEEIMEVGLRQAERTRNYILSTKEAIFKDESGNVVMTLHRDRCRNIYLLNVTLEDLGHLATQTEAVKSLNLLSGNNKVWSVFINDLRVVSEILDDPSLFFLFLDRRLQAGSLKVFRTQDELDFLMHFLRHGLYFEPNNLRDISAFTPHGYTDDLDRYMRYLEGKVATAEKPRFPISEDYWAHIRDLEHNSSPGWTGITVLLLGFSSETQRAWLNGIESTRAKLLRDGRGHDFSITVTNPKHGVTYFVTTQSEQATEQMVARYVRYKMYQLRYNRWSAIVDGGTQTTPRYHIEHFEKQWTFDPELDEQVRARKQMIRAQIKASGISLRRDEPCPCLSGRQYGNCCIRD